MHPTVVYAIIVVTIFGSMAVMLLWTGGQKLIYAWKEEAPKEVWLFYGTLTLFGVAANIVVICYEISNVTAGDFSQQIQQLFQSCLQLLA